MSEEEFFERWEHGTSSKEDEILGEETVQHSHLTEDELNEGYGIIDKYWNDECTDRFIRIYDEYGDYRFRGWVDRRMKYFLDKIVGEQNYELLLNELNKFFERIHKSDLQIINLLLNYYTEILKKSNHYEFFDYYRERRKTIKKCACCGKGFNPYCIHWFYTKKPSMSIKICEECYSKSVMLNKPNTSQKTEGEMLDDLRKLIQILGFIPSQREFLVPADEMTDNFPEKEVEIITLLKDMAGLQQYKDRFGSYFNALVKTGILDENSRSEAFGTRCIAKDGHECRSLAEQYIDNWLFLNGISHSREPYYPEKYLKADWQVGKYFIEYWGLKGQEDYDEKIELKREIAEKNNIPLIEINPSDLQNISSKLKRLKDEYGNPELATYEIALPYNGKKDKLMKELDGRSIDLMKIRGMGYTRIKKLNEAGIYSLEDVKNCSFSKLLSIEGLGDKLIKELLTLVGREEECYLLELKKVPTVWNETLIKLDKAGIKSMKQLSECDAEVLVRTAGIQIYIANNVKKYADSLSNKKKQRD